MDMTKIAIEDDIYLYFWMYYMKPILVSGDTFEIFKMQNQKYKIAEKGWNIPLQEEKISRLEPLAKILDIFIRPF
jgi:hypothetical protein